MHNKRLAGDFFRFHRHQRQSTCKSSLENQLTPSVFVRSGARKLPQILVKNARNKKSPTGIIHGSITVNQEPGKFILAMNIWRLSILALARRLWSIGNDTLVTCKQQNRSYHVPFYLNLKFIQKI